MARAHAAGLYFLCLSNAQKALETRWPHSADGSPVLPALRTFALGAASRATAAIVFCPITVVKTRMVRRRLCWRERRTRRAAGGCRCCAGLARSLAHM